MKPPTCQVNLVPASEEYRAPFRVTYRPCGKPATWYTEDVHVAPAGLHLCEEHQREIAMRVDDDVIFDEVAVAP